MFRLGLSGKTLLMRSDKKFWCKRVLILPKGTVRKDNGRSGVIGEIDLQDLNRRQA
jgi:hypothetical protein